MFVKHRFQLDHMVQDRLHSLIPPFGYNGFGEFIFYRTYSRVKSDGGQEDWADVVIRNVNGTFSIRKDWYLKNHITWDEQYWQDYAAGFALAMYRMQWMPPGRGMWAMGSDFVYERGSMALYNCLAYGTPFYTDEGIFPIGEKVGQTVNVKCIDGKFRPAEVKSFGEQKLRRVTFKPYAIEGMGGKRHFGKSNLRLTYDVTPNHRWVLEDNSDTINLQQGDKVKAKASTDGVDFESQDWCDGYTHGTVFGDGTKLKGEGRYHVDLHADPENEVLVKLINSTYYTTRSQPPMARGRFTVRFKSDRNLKEVPESFSLSYLRGFLDGWIDADGHDTESGSVCLCSQNREAMNWAIDHCALVGYMPTGFSTFKDMVTNLGPRKHPMNQLVLSTKSVTYVVDTIEDLGITEEVFCVVEPATHTFTLAGGIPTSNCAYTDLTSRYLSDDIGWLMDSLMHGVGVGFGPIRDEGLRLYRPVGTYDHVIADSREGWVESEQAIIDAYTKPGRKLPRMIYDGVRDAGLPIRGFGGISSGPGPLKDLHERTIREFELFATRPEYDVVYLKTNLANHTGCCVVAGNVRRSAELAKGKVSDKTFMNLKDYKLYPERESFGWMSNNSVELETDEDFMMLGEIARRVLANGEPGYINRRNMPYGRIGKKMKDLRWDEAVGFNPCGEIPLEHRETCNVAETLPTMCQTHEEWLCACEYATTYMTTVSLLPTHQPSTNRVVARNRRIGASIIDYSGWKLAEGVHRITKYMREGYKRVRSVSKRLNEEAGVPIPIRVTTIKPGGTGPKLPGKTSGVGHPTFDYTCRRVRVAKNSPVHALLAEAGVPYEEDYFDKYTDIFEYPILQGPAKPASQVSIWEQAMNLILVQREWADNAVSNTLYFRPMWPLVEVADCDFEERLRHYFGEVATVRILASRMTEYLVPERYKLKVKYSPDGSVSELRVHEFDPTHEEAAVEPVLSAIAPVTKSVTLLPHSNKGAYRQMPEEGISKTEYERRLAEITRIDWSRLSGSDGIDERYCSGPSCEVVLQ